MQIRGDDNGKSSVIAELQVEMDTSPPISADPVIKFGEDNTALIKVIKNFDNLKIEDSSIRVVGKGIAITHKEGTADGVKIHLALEMDSSKIQEFRLAIPFTVMDDPVVHVRELPVRSIGGESITLSPSALRFSKKTDVWESRAILNTEVVGTHKSSCRDLKLYLRDTQSSELIPIIWETVRDLGSRQIITLKASANAIQHNTTYEIQLELPSGIDKIETNKVVAEFK